MTNPKQLDAELRDIAERVKGYGPCRDKSCSICTPWLVIERLLQIISELRKDNNNGQTD